MTDMDRAKKFYSTVLDLEMIDMPMGELQMCLFSVEPGVSGAPCLQVPLDRVEPAGRKVHIPKRQISPEHGHMAVFEDPEGNRVAFHGQA